MEMIENSPVPKELEDYNLPPEHPTPKPSSTPNAATPVVAERMKEKKGVAGKAPHKRGKLGRNQYTRDRDPPASISPGNGNSSKEKDKNKDPSPAISQARATNGTDTNKTDSDGTVNGSIHGKNGKPKGASSKLEKTSFNEMRRRASGMLEFISRTQVEMAGDKTTVAGAAVSMTLKAVDAASAPEKKDKGFEQMSSLEMMDHLARRLVMWQKDFGT